MHARGRPMVAPTKKGGSICKNSAVLFTSWEFYGIIALVDASGQSYTQSMLDDIIDLVYELTGEDIVRFIHD